MGGFREYDKYDATGLAELVRKKKVSPRELCEEAISRIEQLNPQLNAVIYTLFEEALRDAEGPLHKGPFTGVPFLIKDVIQALAGTPLTFGCQAWRNNITGFDSEYVARLKRTGLVILGKTNVPEFGLMPCTEPELFGPTRNPWNTDKSPGGSSGGSGAAVASRMVPMAAGNDGGGSIRIPASCCGVFGLKPTRGRNPLGPDYGEEWQGAVVEHVLTLSVRDSAALLDATAGEDCGAPTSFPRRSVPILRKYENPPESCASALPPVQ